MSLNKIYNKVFKNKKVYEGYFTAKGIDADNKKIVVFGTGEFSEVISSTIPYEVSYYVDNDQTKWGTLFFDKPVKSPDELKNEDKENVFVIIASQYFYEISYQLTNDLGYEQDKNFDWGKILFDQIEDYYYLTKIAFMASCFVFLPVTGAILLRSGVKRAFGKNKAKAEETGEEPAAE